MGTAPDTTFDLDTIPKEIAMDTINKDTIYKIVETMPKFLGCDGVMSESESNTCSHQQLMLYILRTFKMPKNIDMTESNILVSFVINKNGKVQSAKILQGIHPDFDVVFLEVISKMPSWTPGQYKGKNVNVEMMLPMKFHFQINKK